MEKRNTLLLTVVAVATLLVAVIGATFAYFAASAETNETLNLTAQTQGASQFVATPGDAISLNITADKMQEAASSANPLAVEDNGTLTVKLSSPAEGTNVSCTYDIKYVDTGAHYTRAANLATGVNEFTLEGTNDTDTAKSMAVTDYSTLSGTTVNKETTVITGATINANTVAGTSTVWTFTAKFYNVNVPQATGQSYSGYFKVDNVVC